MSRLGPGQLLACLRVYGRKPRKAGRYRKNLVKSPHPGGLNQGL